MKHRSKSRTKSGHPMSRMGMINYTRRSMRKGINALLKALCSPKGCDDANTEEMRRVVKTMLNIMKKGIDAMSELAKEGK